MMEQGKVYKFYRNLNFRLNKEMKALKENRNRWNRHILKNVVIGKAIVSNKI